MAEKPNCDSLAGVKSAKVHGNVIISLENCLLSEDRLSCTPSSLDGLDPETEMDLRILGCELIQTAGILLRLPQVVEDFPNLPLVSSLFIASYFFSLLLLDFFILYVNFLQGVSADSLHVSRSLWPLAKCCFTDSTTASHLFASPWKSLQWAASAWLQRWRKLLDGYVMSFLFSIMSNKSVVLSEYQCFVRGMLTAY